jgi:hypothetical protein
MSVGGHFCGWPFYSSLDWRPALRAVTATLKRVTVPGPYPAGMGRETDISAKYLLRTDGICELSLFSAITEQRQGFYIEWLIRGLGYMLSWIEVIRKAADAVPVEFALAPLIEISSDAIIAEYGTKGFDEARGHRTPRGHHEFPIASVGGSDEFANHLSRFDEDIWNLAGCDVQRSLPTFHIDL